MVVAAARKGKCKLQSEKCKMKSGWAAGSSGSAIHLSDSQISRNSSTASRMTAGSGSSPGPDFEIQHSLIDEHPQAVERCAAAPGGLAQQPGVGRIDDNIRNHQTGIERLDLQWQSRRPDQDDQWRWR